MSVVAVRVEATRIEFAADSITIRGYTQSKKSAKLSQLKNGMIIGGTGLAEATILFQQYAATRQPKSATAEDLVAYLAEFHAWYRKKTEDANRDIDENEFIIAFAGKAFHCIGYYVKEITDFEAIGAGMDYALSAMYLGESAHKAVETAIELSIYCEYPIVDIVMERGIPE